MSDKTSLTGLILIRLAAFTALIILVVIALWILRYYVAAAILGTGTGALLLLLVVLVTSYVSRKQTIETMRAGAEIALKAQQINDTWDAKKTAAMSNLVREGMRLGAGNIPQLPGPAPLPLPGEWLQLPDQIDVDFDELEGS